jgi:D-tyrosyl-tRNA(Tyr) deacylase
VKLLIQRVSRASVSVDGTTIGAIGRGVLALVGVERGDDASLAAWYARRLAAMKLFPGEDRLWERTLVEVGGGVLVVSQFTLAARTRKGRRPSFDPAAPPEVAAALCGQFAETLRKVGLAVEEGRFGAMMQVELVNDGPVTFLLEGPAPAPDERGGGS